MDLHETAKALRLAADRLEGGLKQLLLPTEEYTLAQAVAALQAAFPGKNVSIDLSVSKYTFNDTPSVEWKVWHDTEQYKGSTLTAAMAAALASAPTGDALPQAEAVLEASSAFPD